jgi:hypothetical protein
MTQNCIVGKTNPTPNAPALLSSDAVIPSGVAACAELDFSQPAARFVAHHQLTRCIPVHHPKPLARSKPLMHETSELIACKGLAIIGPATLQLCSSPGMIFASICGYGNLQKIGNFFHLPPSNPMSSLSGAHDEIETPPSGVSVAQQAEADLLRRAQFGDRAAFGQIVLRFQDRLYNSILRLVGDVEEARDLTQETFTRALVKIESFRGEAGPYTWLFRIAVNLAISQLRKVQKHRVFSLDAASGGNGQTSRRGAGRSRRRDTWRFARRAKHQARAGRAGAGGAGKARRGISRGPRDARCGRI